MNINKPDDIGSNEITDERTYLNRRRFIRAGIVVGTAIATGVIYQKLNSRKITTVLPPELANLAPATAPAGPLDESITRAFQTTEAKTLFDDITHYNNFYEFSTNKFGIAELAGDFKTRPWMVEVGGLCSNPKTFDIDELLKLFPAEERVYRMRCVEAWSMVIPWNGFSLSRLLERVGPLSGAKYVAFETILAPNQMPGQRQAVLPWPYVEGLRIDEAMHPLTILATGIYGRELPVQDGAPIRLVVPWKYGFKGIKSIVKIHLVADEPPCTWNLVAPREYGFYANVNPEVDHPRWSQADEQRIGEATRRPTLKFNGYGEQVASLYTAMDLQRNF